MNTGVLWEKLNEKRPLGKRKRRCGNNNKMDQQNNVGGRGVD
jgi:hypothetical protein